MCSWFGSSPLARGAQVHRPLGKLVARLIPAGAGSTCGCPFLCAAGSAHPRWRGEHYEAKTDLSGIPGSSPLARGARHLAGPAQPRQRLIPAGAGSTPGYVKWVALVAAHPRWRGEHRAVSLTSIAASGSSPLARGAPITTIARPRVRRLIPAGAGSTTTSALSGLVIAAHPRWRGEHTGVSGSKHDHIGSSPLARGAPGIYASCGGEGGLIPAGAGSTCLTSSNRLSPTAHPRWRGEHKVPSARERRGDGSSPLARGAPVGRRLTVPV